MELDVRGLSCPEPVLKVKKALEKENKLVVLVDNPTALNNITRFVTNNGGKITKEEKSGEYILTIEK